MNTTWIRTAWEKASRVPLGPAVFSRLVGAAAPYTGSIGARVVELAPGHARVTLRDRRAVRNHLQSIHAVALVNLAELTGNLALLAGLPDDARFIVKGLSIEYVKKARGTITASADLEPPTTAEKRELTIAVSLRDESGDEVARASLLSLVGPKPAKA